LGGRFAFMFPWVNAKNSRSSREGPIPEADSAGSWMPSSMKSDPAGVASSNDEGALPPGEFRTGDSGMAPSSVVALFPQLSD